MEALASEIGTAMRSVNVPYILLMREKNQETLVSKMKLKGTEDISSINDVYGFRILVREELDIYVALRKIMAVFPGFLDYDYVAAPKRRSDLPGKELRLVKYVVRRNQASFEIQITTHEWNTANEELHAAYHRRKYGLLPK